LSSPPCWAACFSPRVRARPGCQRKERVAILRFENLGADASQDWMGRALSELVAGQLTGRPNRYAISSGTLHALSPRRRNPPERRSRVSAESDLALAAGANRVGYGEFAVRGGRAEARLFLEDLPAHKYAQAISASARRGRHRGGRFAGAPDRARRGSARRAQQRGVRDYVNALEGGAPGDIMRDAGRLHRRDPDSLPAYRLLAEWKAMERDAAGALALLDTAAQRAVSPLERARVHLQSAGLRSDAAGRLEALAEMASADPGKPGSVAHAGRRPLRHARLCRGCRCFPQTTGPGSGQPQRLELLAYASANAGDLPAAVEALRRYQAAAPEDPNPIDSLATFT